MAGFGVGHLPDFMLAPNEAASLVRAAVQHDRVVDVPLPIDERDAVGLESFDALAHRDLSALDASDRTHIDQWNARALHDVTKRPDIGRIDPPIGTDRCSRASSLILFEHGEVEARAICLDVGMPVRRDGPADRCESEEMDDLTDRRPQQTGPDSSRTRAEWRLDDPDSVRPWDRTLRLALRFPRENGRWYGSTVVPIWVVRMRYRC